MTTTAPRPTVAGALRAQIVRLAARVTTPLAPSYCLDYVSGPLPKQVASARKKVFRLALPDDVARRATAVFGSAMSARTADAAA